MRRRFPLFCCLAVVMAGLASGCTESDGVRQYTVEKAKKEAPAAAKTAWFFKVMGGDGLVAGQAERFAQLIKSVEFDKNGEPKWTLPEGWTQKPGTGMRHSTITIPGEPPLEISVTPMRSLDPESPKYILDNLNLWREQLGLSRHSTETGLKEATDAGELNQFKIGDASAALVNLFGKSDSGDSARMLVGLRVSNVASDGPAPQLPSAKPGFGEAMGAPRTGLSSTSSRPKPFTATVPEDWQESPPRQFQAALYLVKNDKGTLEVSVSSAGGDLLGNVNRWQGQAKLDNLTEEQVKALAVPITIDGIEAQLYPIEGAARVIYGIILQREGVQWFIKADGPPEIAKQERAKFEEFARSLKFVAGP